jgi:hypothetical protein
MMMKQKDSSGEIHFVVQSVHIVHTKQDWPLKKRALEWHH